MALSEDDKKELVNLMGDGFIAGLKKYRAEVEEAEAKANAEKGGDNKESSDDDNGGQFNLGAFFLGR